MPLTKDFKETIQARARRDSAFREALLKEAIDSLLSGDVETGKTVLRDYINATVGFDELAAVTKKSPKSLMRMLGPSGNPQARNFFEIVAYLQKKEGVQLKVRSAETYYEGNGSKRSSSSSRSNRSRPKVCSSRVTGSNSYESFQRFKRSNRSTPPVSPPRHGGGEDSFAATCKGDRQSPTYRSR